MLSATPEQWERWDKRARRAGVRWAVLVRALLNLEPQREPRDSCSVCDRPLARAGAELGAGTHVLVGQLIVGELCPSCVRSLTGIRAPVRRTA